MDITDSISLINGFRGNSLPATLSSLEESFSGISGAESSIKNIAHGFDLNLLASGFQVKMASAQIDVIIHSLGILLSLPTILESSEIIEVLSLGAGNTGKDFDLITDQRIGEFKFIQWQGGPESIRQNSIFKDFFYLAEEDTQKSRYLYLLETERPLRFFNGKRILSSVLSRNQRLRDDFLAKYGESFRVVRDYYEYRRSKVDVIDLRDLVSGLEGILNQIKAP